MITLLHPFLLQNYNLILVIIGCFIIFHDFTLEFETLF